MNTFAKQPNIQLKALQKALESPRIGKHGKRRITLLREEVQREIIQKALGYSDQAFDKLISIINSEAKVAGDKEAIIKAIKELLNRGIGAVTQKQDITTRGKPIRFTDLTLNKIAELS